MDKPKIEEFEYKEHTIEFIKFGRGSDIMLAFHGFGRNCYDWLDFDSTFSKHYTIYSFNLFFHGNSVYGRDHYEYPLEKVDIVGIINTFRKDFKIDKFALLGYSLGGRIALTAIEKIKNKITKAYLFAPDGVVDNWWYELGAKTKIGNLICKILVSYPQPVLWLVKLLNIIKILDDRFLKFVTMHMESKTQRKQVFDSWIVHRKLTPKINRIKENVNLYKIPIHVFVGKYDKIITPKIIRPLSEGIERELYHFTILKEGHKLIRPKTNTWLKDNYLDKI